MKTIFTGILAMLVINSLIMAQDNLYIYKGGTVVSMRAVGDIDSIIFNIPGNPANDIVFNPNLTYGSVTDIDNNSYKTIQIGTQTWMGNLKTTKFNDGTAIPLVTGNSEWSALSTPAYCWYNNDSATYNAIFGALYNWLTVDTTSNGSKNVCPTGWHVPTDAEWTVLTDYLGGEEVAGGKLKEAGLAHWADPNTGATNETGFTALPGGYRVSYGTFNLIGIGGGWWSSGGFDTSNAWLRGMFYDYSNVYNRSYLDYLKRNGFSVRCVKDE